MDIKNIVISTAKDSGKIHAFNIQSENKRTVCSLPLEQVGPFRFDAFLDHKDACKTCKRQVLRWMAPKCANCKSPMPPADENPFNQICPNCSEPR